MKAKKKTTPPPKKKIANLNPPEDPEWNYSVERICCRCNLAKPLEWFWFVGPCAWMCATCKKEEGD